MLAFSESQTLPTTSIQVMNPLGKVQGLFSSWSVSRSLKKKSNYVCEKYKEE